MCSSHNRYGIWNVAPLQHVILRQILNLVDVKTKRTIPTWDKQRGPPWANRGARVTFETGPLPMPKFTTHITTYTMLLQYALSKGTIPRIDMGQTEYSTCHSCESTNESPAIVVLRLPGRLLCACFGGQNPERLCCLPDICVIGNVHT